MMGIGDIARVTSLRTNRFKSRNISFLKSFVNGRFIHNEDINSLHRRLHFCHGAQMPPFQTLPKNMFCMQIFPAKWQKEVFCPTPRPKS
jgi:hypothetical protein